MKIICAIIICAMILPDAAWSGDGHGARGSGLAAYSGFQKDPVNPEAAKYRKLLYSAGGLINSVCCIGDYFFRGIEDGAEPARLLRYLEPALTDLGGSLEAIDVPNARFENGAVIVPYENSGELYDIHISSRKDPAAAGPEWTVLSDTGRLGKYAVKVIHKGKKEAAAFVPADIEPKDPGADLEEGPNAALIPQIAGIPHDAATTVDPARANADTNVLVIGAGKIGRGVVGQLLSDSGYRITFVDKDADIVNALQRSNAYTINIYSPDGRINQKRISGIEALHRAREGEITDAMLRADTVFMSVFEADFDNVASLIARGIEKRIAGNIKRPVNVVVVSNKFSTEYIVREAILRNLPPLIRREADGLLGVIDTVTFNIVPNVPEAARKIDPALIQIGSDAGLLADTTKFKGPPIHVAGIEMTDNLEQAKLRKLYTYNGAHAICAYTGYLKGYVYIQDAIKDPLILDLVKGSLEEMRGLLGAWDDYDEYIKKVIKDFSDEHIRDDVSRVGQDPARKLSTFDRLVGPARLAMANKRIPSAYATGIAAALLYDNPDDTQAHYIQNRMAAGDPVDAVICGICGLHPESDAQLISLIREKIDVLRKEKAKKQLRDIAASGRPDKTVKVTGRIPHDVKLVMWDFDNVIADTPKYYAHATATVYWRIRKGAKRGAGAPADDPIFQEGKKLYYGFLPGRATYLTIMEAIKKAKEDGRPDTELESADEYYHEFESERERIFTDLTPSEFFNPGMRELIYTVRALNPRVEFCVNTALDQNFFQRQFMKRGFRGYFSAARALTGEERAGDTINTNKVKNGMALIRERGLDPSQVVFIDDSYKIMKMVKEQVPGAFTIGVSTDTASGEKLIDAGADIVMTSMRPTPDKLMMFGIRQESTGDIKSAAKDVYVIKSGGANRQTKIDPLWEARFRKNIPFIIKTPEARQKLEKLFEALVQKGDIRPNVVINIKNYSPNAVSVYMDALREISSHYNGNVTFVLVVEEDIYHFSNDMPSSFTALAKAKEVLGDDFYRNPTVMIADGGRKLRNMPLTLAYLYEGLMPYSRDRSRLHEIFVRSGGLMLQMPDFGRNDCIIVASDSVFNTEKISTLRADWPLAAIPPVKTMSVPGVPILGEEMKGKIVCGVDGDRKALFVLAKPTQRASFDYMSRYPPASLYGLHFLTIWNKGFLNRFLLEMKTSTMEDGRPFLEIPSDMFMSLFQSTCMTADEWLSYRPQDQTGGVSEPDWLTMREIALKFFGPKIANVTLLQMAANAAFTDEGILRRAMPRFKLLVRKDLNTVKKSPDVVLCNAAAASLDRVVIKGRGRIVFGRNVQLSNVVIEMDGEELFIPDYWTISNSYIQGSCFFKNENGYLINAALISSGQSRLLPLHAEFTGENVTTVVSTLGGREVVVGIPLDAKRADLEAMRFGGYRLMHLQEDADILGNLLRTEMLAEKINDEFAAMPNIFPLHKDAVVEETRKEVRYDELVEMIASRIISEHSGDDRQYWVTLEGLQGSGKTHLIHALTESLRSRGKNVVVMEEDWYHLDRATREARRSMYAGLGERRWMEHFELWHDWKRLRGDLEKLRGAREGTLVLDRLYDRDAHGELTRRVELTMTKGAVCIYSGFYVSDKGKADIPADLSIYLGVSPGESMKTKLGRDRWRAQHDIAVLDNKIYRPALARYIQTNDPAARADIVVSFDDIDNRSRVSIVTPLTRQANSQKPAAPEEVKAAANQLPETLGGTVTDTRSRFIKAVKGLSYLLLPPKCMAVMRLPGLDTRRVTAEIMLTARSVLEELYEKREYVNIHSTAQEAMTYLIDNFDSLEAQSIIGAIVTLAVRAKRENQKLIIGLETDWIPGIDEKGYGSQHDAINAIMKQIDSLGDTLRSLGIDNVEIVHEHMDDVAAAVLAKAESTHTRLSNVILLASSRTVFSFRISLLQRNSKEMPFFAAVDASKLKDWYDKNKGSGKQLDIRILEMLSIALELAVGKMSPDTLTIVTEYNREERTVIFAPAAEPIDYDDLTHANHSRLIAMQSA